MRITFSLLLMMASVSVLYSQTAKDTTFPTTGKKGEVAYNQLLEQSFALKTRDSLQADQLARAALDTALKQEGQHQIAESRLNYGRILLHHLEVDSALVQLLAMQLNGKLEVKNEDGMKTILRFKTNRAA